jgi:hypothetical protein
MTRSTARSSGTRSSDAASPGVKKTSAKKTAARETAPKATAAKKATARKGTAKKATAKATAEAESPSKQAPVRSPARETSSSGDPSSEPDRDGTPQTAGSAGPLRASEVALEAAAQLLDLVGKEAEGVVGINRTDAGWVVQVEVLELRRIPSTTDVLAVYEATLDEDGVLIGYRRLHRYVRGTSGED